MGTNHYLVKGKKPYEIFFGCTPSYKNIIIFGCLAYAHNQKHGGDKFANRSKKCVFLGNPFEKKGWSLYDLDSSEFFVSRDVIFEKDDFPYKVKVSIKQKKIGNNTLDDLMAEEEVKIGVVDQEKDDEVGVWNSDNEEPIEEFSGDVTKGGGGGGGEEEGR